MPHIRNEFDKHIKDKNDIIQYWLSRYRHIRLYGIFSQQSIRQLPTKIRELSHFYIIFNIHSPNQLELIYANIYQHHTKKEFIKFIQTKTIDNNFVFIRSESKDINKVFTIGKVDIRK